MAWFESRKTQERKSRFKQLVDMALADDELDPAEQDLLQAIAEGLSLSPKEFEQILANPDRVPFKPPHDLDDRLLQFAEVVDMMRADDQIKESEKQYAVRIAGRLGLPPAKAPRLVEQILRSVDTNMDWLTLNAQLRATLKEGKA